MIGPKLVLTLIAVLILAAGCAGGGTPVVYYTLQPAASVKPIPDVKFPEIGIGPVTLPDYLDRSALVTRISPNQLHIHQGHHWAGSLRDDILRIVATNLKSACPGMTILPHPWSVSDLPTARFRLSILAFEGRPGGEVDLKVAWSVEDNANRPGPLAPRNPCPSQRQRRRSGSLHGGHGTSPGRPDTGDGQRYRRPCR